MHQMKKMVCLVMLACGVGTVQSHDFAGTAGGTVVASYDVPGSEIWDGFFASPSRFLAQPVDGNRWPYKYINHPRYIRQSLPVHRTVCELGDQSGNGDQDRCKDEFPHVHFDDFKIGLNFANDTCAGHGAGVVPKFNAPATFVNGADLPAASHHYYYMLEQGLQFDCVALATY